jgi:glycosyltransferase involved in cell wall biosynthesis
VPDRTRIPDSYFARLDAEWNEASVVLVNSQWSRQALLEQGVDGSKIVVIPLFYRARVPPTGIFRRERRPSDPLKVLWLGTLCLRKGLPYALEAAKLLVGAPVSFSFAGGAGVPLEKLSLPENCRYLGAIPRVNVPAIYAQHDVFILPTLSDGFALTQVEALHYGLPVIATPCCGEVVVHGKCGFIVPPRNARAIADAVLQLVEDHSLLRSMSLAAHRRARDFSPDGLRQDWLKVIRPNAAAAPG